MSDALTWALVVAVLVSTAVRLWLDARQVRHVMAHRAQVPAAFVQRVSLGAHQKAADYTAARTRLSSLATLITAATLVGWTLMGGLDWLNTSVRDAVQPRWGTMAYQLALLAAVSIVGGLIDLPLSIYSTFVLEQRFGFNRTSWQLWLTDNLKGMAVGVAMGLPLAAAVLWVMGSTGGLWWLWAWGLLMAFQALLMVIYPTVIAPLFNRFVPLPDQGLRERVQALMTRCGFKAKGLFVMDGSRRSAHGNAYFTGLGAAKRVVFFDTLLQRLSHAEVEAVLAHELGHFHHKHISKRLALMAVISFAALAFLGYVSSMPWFYTGLGVTPNAAVANDALALTLFTMVLPSFVFFVAPWMSLSSRRDEFEADRYAARHASGQDLGSALLKLYEDNAGTLTPDPMYVAFHASHPPASQRLAALGYTR
jgi:STE24 endopeptidase